MARFDSSERAARDPWDIGFGAAVVLGALLSLLVWFPNDIRGDFITFAPGKKPEPGDAFFPVLLAGLLLILGAGQLLFALFSRSPQQPSGSLSADNLRFLLTSYAIIFAGLAIMYWLGPLAVEAMRQAGAIEQTYRQLIDTAPYKYLGFAVGGYLMTASLIVLAEGQVRLRALAAVAIVLVLLVIVLDVLLYNIQLPPNADY